MSPEELQDFLEEEGKSVEDLVSDMVENLDLFELFETGSVSTEVAGKALRFGLIVEEIDQTGGALED